MHKQLLSLSLFLCSTATLAMPTVSGNTISWPNDGWYQVQRADTYESVCNGGSSCDVDPGTYIVINHSTRERFNAIEVGSIDSPTESPINVMGNTIFWPNDGWYQVQQAESYESVCNGGSSCEVDIGVYIVINHSTGERFSDINVGSIDSPIEDSITVTGDTISWADDGWYQVQRADTYESICEGGASCVLEDGVYNVINHSSDQRWDGIEIVTTVETPEIIDMPATLNEGNMALIIGAVFDIFTGRDEFASQIYALPNFSDERVVSSPETLDCSAGGTASIGSQAGGRSAIFDMCIDGDSTLNGSITTYIFTSDFIIADNFTQQGSGISQALSADRVRLFPGSWDVDNLDYLYQNMDGNFVLNDASFYWTRAVNSGNTFTMSTEGSFSVSSTDVVNGVTLTASAVGLSTIIPPREVFDRFGTLVDYPSTMSNVFYTEGTLQILAEDGSEITLNAATGDMETVSVEILQDGVTKSATLHQWIDWKTNLRTDVVGLVP